MYRRTYLPRTNACNGDVWLAGYWVLVIRIGGIPPSFIVKFTGGRVCKGAPIFNHPVTTNFSHGVQSVTIRGLVFRTVVPIRVTSSFGVSLEVGDRFLFALKRGA